MSLRVRVVVDAHSGHKNRLLCVFTCWDSHACQQDQRDVAREVNDLVAFWVESTYVLLTPMASED